MSDGIAGPRWWQAPLGGRLYLLVGGLLFLIKQGIDRGIAAAFGREWSFYNYIIPTEAFNPQALGPDDRWFVGSLLAAAAPFIVVGVILTARRLRTVGLPPILAILFFLPTPINVLFFLAIGLTPALEVDPRRQATAWGGKVRPRPIPATPDEFGKLDPVDPELDADVWAAPRGPVGLQRFVPENHGGGFLAALLLPWPFILGLGWLVSTQFRDYGWGLFVGLPFIGPFVSVMLYGARRRRPYSACVSMAMAWVGLGFAGMLVFLFEGIICLAMTLPLVVPVALLGASLGYHLQASPRDPGGMSRLLLLLAGASVPLFATEALTPDRPMRQSVVTAVVIAAPPEVVWPRVVAFPPLPEPSDWMLRDTGIAYPIGARIEGKGPGACRHCEFSTGAFVEPITVWREAELLRFDVVASPPTMVEWNPFANIQPPHLEGFLHSKQGQFRLQRLDDGSTLLEGTTWYENAMWPSSYWDVWCRTIIGKIHREVLEHVKNLAEGDERSL